MKDGADDDIPRSQSHPHHDDRHQDKPCPVHEPDHPNRGPVEEPSKKEQRKRDNRLEESDPLEEPDRFAHLKDRPAAAEASGSREGPP